MSLLTVYRDDAAGVAELRTEAGAAIAAALAPIGVRFERWDDAPAVADGADAAAVLAAFRPHLDRLMGATGAGSADVVRMTPEHPDGAALRAKFLGEHVHTEDEIRFFVRGSGNFVLHAEGRVFDVRCTQGDLIGVPAGMKHWFDAGERPRFTVLRVFSDSSGWVAHYTGDRISERFAAA